MVWLDSGSESMFRNHCVWWTYVYDWLFVIPLHVVLGPFPGPVGEFTKTLETRITVFGEIWLKRVF